MRKISKIVELVKQIRIEPYLFMVVFTISVKDVSQQTLILDRVCRLHFNYSEEICSNLTNYDSILSSVQKIATRYKIGYSLITILPSIISATLLSPWSDKYGRKFPILAATFGLMLEACGLLVVGLIRSAPAYFLIIAGIPSGLFGGFLMAISSTYTYLSDITNKESRAIRYALLEFAFILGFPIGIEVGAKVYEMAGIVMVYATALIILCCSFFWVFFFVKETRGKEEEKNLKEMISHLFQLDNLKDSLHTCIAPRPGNIKAQIWLTIIGMTVAMFGSYGSMTVGYFFANKMYKWDNSRFSAIASVVQITHGIGLIISIPIFTKYLKIPESIIALLGILSYMGENAIKTVAYYEWMYFYAYFVGFLGGISGVAVRSRLSKLVTQDELSKIFSLLALTESLTPVFATIVFNEVYAETVSTFLGASYLLIALCLIIPAGIFIWLSKQSLPSTSEDINEGGYRMESFSEWN